MTDAFNLAQVLGILNQLTTGIQFGSRKKNHCYEQGSHFFYPIKFPDFFLTFP